MKLIEALSLIFEGSRGREIPEDFLDSLNLDLVSEGWLVLSRAPWVLYRQDEQGNYWATTFNIVESNIAQFPDGTSIWLGKDYTATYKALNQAITKNLISLPKKKRLHPLYLVPMILSGKVIKSLPPIWTQGTRTLELDLNEKDKQLILSVSYPIFSQPFVIKLPLPKPETITETILKIVAIIKTIDVKKTSLVKAYQNRANTYAQLLRQLPGVKRIKRVTLDDNSIMLTVVFIDKEILPELIVPVRGCPRIVIPGFLEKELTGCNEFDVVQQGIASGKKASEIRELLRQVWKTHIAEFSQAIRTTLEGN